MSDKDNKGELKPLDNLKGMDGLWVFLNHPMREPKLDGYLQDTYERLFSEAGAEFHAKRVRPSTPKEDKREEWISVEDGLPELGKMVLLGNPAWPTVNRGSLAVDGLEKEWTFISGAPVGLDYYTHWMPLPSPPKAHTEKEYCGYCHNGKDIPAETSAFCRHCYRTALSVKDQNIKEERTNDAKI